MARTEERGSGMSVTADNAGQDFATFEARLRGSNWTVLFQSPRSAWFAKFGANGWETAPACVGDGTDVGLPDGGPGTWPDRVFEARAFDGTHEVRWLRKVNGGAIAEIKLRDAQHQGRDNHLEPIAGNRLLWGTAADNQPTDRTGWTIMESDRIGRYPLPIKLASGGRSVLKVLETLTIDDHGNISVADELWIGMEVFRG